MKNIRLQIQNAKTELERLKVELFKIKINNDNDITVCAFKINSFFEHFIEKIDGDELDKYDISEKIQNLFSGMRNIPATDRFNLDQIDMLKLEILWLIDQFLSEIDVGIED